jgi:hypothetical protein
MKIISVIFLLLFLLGAYSVFQKKIATSDQALLKQWWKIYGPDENIGKCSDVYFISEKMLQYRDQWSVKYRYLSGDIVLTVTDLNGLECVYISKK